MSCAASRRSGVHSDFFFVVGARVLSFADVRPRALSELDYAKGGEFRADDLLAGLSYRGGELHLDTDYVRVRRMKTGVEKTVGFTVRRAAPREWIPPAAEGATGELERRGRR
jgi:hypothetical protein